MAKARGERGNNSREVHARGIGAEQMGIAFAGEKELDSFFAAHRGGKDRAE